MEEIKIKARWITDPPEKVRLIYEAIARLIREGREVSGLKVSDITSLAGIGKGTAYEYFSSKEEIVAHALMYVYSEKIRLLLEAAFSPADFRERFEVLLDWIRDNQADNHLLMNTLKGLLQEPACQEKQEDDFRRQTSLYISGRIHQFMDFGLTSGCFTQTDANKQTLALIGAVMQYVLVIGGPADSPARIGGEEELRDFVYHSLIRALT